MNFIKIKGLEGGYPEKVEGTDEWYYCKLAHDTFCDLYEAEEIVNAGNTYEGMNCVLIHFPEGTVYEPFERKKNRYVEAPVYLDGMLYFMVVDFDGRQIQIVSFDSKTNEKNTVTEISLDEVEDCYNLMLRVAPLTLIRDGQDGFLDVVWPEKKKIEMAGNEVLQLRDEDDLYFSAWYEDPDYHEKVIVRDWNTGEVKKCFDGSICRMSNGDVWVF